MPVHHVEHVMGTSISIDVVDSDDIALVQQVVAWFHEVDEVFSPYKETSTITRIGRGEVGLDDPALTEDVIEVLEECERLLVDSNGVFDVWSLPSPNGTNFDPCGYVKGWSVERAARLLDAAGVQHYSINAGGDVLLRGRNHEGRPWRIGVRHPDDAASLAFIIEAEGPLGIATSGSYERGAHIRDPRTGEPSTDLASATVVGPSLAIADALATTLYVMGPSGLSWCQGHDTYGGAVITRDLHLITTEGFDQYLAD